MYFTPLTIPRFNFFLAKYYHNPNHGHLACIALPPPPAYADHLSRIFTTPVSLAELSHPFTNHGGEGPGNTLVRISPFAER